MSYIYISEKPKVLLVSCESFTYSYKISDDGEIPAFVSSKMGLLDVDIIYYDRQKIKVLFVLKESNEVGVPREERKRKSIYKYRSWGYVALTIPRPII